MALEGGKSNFSARFHPHVLFLVGSVVRSPENPASAPFPQQQIWSSVLTVPCKPDMLLQELCQSNHGKEKSCYLPVSCKST